MHSARSQVWETTKINRNGGTGKAGTERIRSQRDGGREEELGVGGQEERGCIQTYQPIIIYVQLLIES